MFVGEKTVLAALSFFHVFAHPAQAPVEVSVTNPPRKLQGRFLQITDMHPDGYYRVNASLSSSCHKRKPKKEKERSGYYGTPYGDCDSPFALTNLTLNFIDKHWTPDIDFVIWTGDNARHDNDRKLPRTTDEIYDLNRAVAERMERVFTSQGIPVIPSIGNNDVWPHNIMTPGPNRITNEFSSIWKKFIPFPSYQVFQRGAYYSVEVVPNALAVISLNTMYFYDSNKAVGGCEYTDITDPGNLEFDWLEVQLKLFRSRNVQVWLSGHVPPSPGNYFRECFVRYVELSLRFQDTILGHLFGHMNADHFFLLESGDLDIPSESQNVSPKAVRKDLFGTLIADFESLPKKIDHDKYAVINVSPPVVPNPYLPTFRVFSYNISGVSEAGISKNVKRRHGHRRGSHGNKSSQCNDALNKDTWECRLNEEWHSDPMSPSRRNALWSPLGYAQFYLPNLETANETNPPEFKLEYLTHPVSALRPSGPVDGGHSFWYPIPLRLLPRSLRNVTITTSKYAPYQMDDLTIPSWIQLAQKLGKPKQIKLRRKFREFMYMRSEGT